MGPEGTGHLTDNNLFITQYLQHSTIKSSRDNNGDRLDSGERLLYL